MGWTSPASPAVGTRGRVRKADVLAALEVGPPPPLEPRGRVAGDLPRGYDDVPHELVTPSRQRKLIAEHMIRSRQTAAHMTTEAEVDLSAVVLARDGAERRGARRAARARSLTSR